MFSIWKLEQKLDNKEGPCSNKDRLGVIFQKSRVHLHAMDYSPSFIIIRVPKKCTFMYASIYYTWSKWFWLFIHSYRIKCNTHTSIHNITNVYVYLYIYYIQNCMHVTKHADSYSNMQLYVHIPKARVCMCKHIRIYIYIYKIM